MDILAAAQMTLRETIEMVFGVALGALILFYILAAPILWYKRHFYYEKIKSPHAEKLLEDPYYAYIQSKTKIKLSKQQLHEFLIFEYAHFKNQNFKHLAGLGVASPAAGFAYDMVANLGRKKAVAKKLSEEFDFLDRKQALRLIQLEDKYLRKFYPLWRRLV